VVVSAPALQPAPDVPSTTTIAPPVRTVPVAPEPPVEVPTAPLTPVPPQPQPTRPVYGGPVSGKLTCNGTPVVQNGEVVFGGLPPGRLEINYDTEVWDLRIRPDENDTQKLVLRNKRAGVRRNCTISWKLVE